jgi:nucleotide-binding universal stress UspA family protein
MFKRILVPLDGSAIAEIALSYAEEMAIHLGSEVFLVNVRMPSEPPDKPAHQAYISRMAAATEQKIKKSKEISAGEKVKVASAIIGSSGTFTHPAEEILSYAEKENITLIVMATHGRTGIRRWALGSTADKVARATKCPILLVRAKTNAPKSVHLNKLLVPLDGSRPSEAVLPYVKHIAAKLKSKVTLLYVIELLYHYYPYSEMIGYNGAAAMITMPYTEEEMKPSKEAGEKYIKSLSDILTAGGIQTDYKVIIGHAGTDIIRVERETHPDIVVMSTHGHSGFGRWDHGSIADKVLRTGNTPILMVRPQQSKVRSAKVKH